MKIDAYTKPTPRELRKFGLVVGLVFVGVIGLLLPLWRHRHIPVWPFVPGVPLLVLGLVAPRLLGPAHRAWMLLGGALGWINMRIILSVVFLVILTPLGLIRRVIGKDSLGLRSDRALGTYRSQVPVLARDRLKEPF
jgi:hypothetical protein